MAQSYTRRISPRSGVGSSEILYSENLLRLYPRDGSEARIVTAPGYRRIASLGGRCNGIFRYGELMLDGKAREIFLLHFGEQLYVSDLRGSGEFLSVGRLADAPSFGFRFGGCFYLLDGEGYRRVLVRAEGAELSGEILEVPIYQPIEASEGVAYEAGNLLSPISIEKRRILSLESYGEGSPGLRFSIENVALREAALVGGEVSGELRVPSFTMIGGEYYRVVKIAPSAFEGKSEISAVRLGLEIREVGEGAFRLCTSLSSFSAPGKLETIGYSAFAGCESLETIALGKSILSIRAYATEGCTALSELLYAGADFSAVSVGLLGNDRLRALTPITSAEIPSFEDPELRFPLLTSADEVACVTLDGEEIPFESAGEISYRCERDDDGMINSVIIYAENPRGLYGKELLITRSLADRRRGELSSLFSRYPEYSGSVREAIFGCRVGACYDGRIFLGGNPKLPGAVFYTSRCADGEMHPGYFGIYSYFVDGNAGASLLGLLASSEGLWVFTDEDDGCGIYCHVGLDSDLPLSPRIYPIAKGHFAEGRYLDAILYRDEAILLTTRGVSAIRKTSLGETRLVYRDEGIGMICGLTPGARLGVWLGYLAVFAQSGELWLGDGRETVLTPSGERRYTWWRLSGVTGYRGAGRLYRYASRLGDAARDGGLTLAPPAYQDLAVSGEVISEGDLTYTMLDGQRTEVVSCGEEVGGERLGFTACLAFEDELLFGDGLGTLYRFATDRRGMPASVAIGEYSESELADFRRRHPDYLAPEWYHFDRHAIRQSLVSGFDDCGRIGERKSTEKRSTLLDLRATGRFELIAITDDGRRWGEGEQIGGGLDFESFRFDALAFTESESACANEETKKWHRKQYVIRAEGIETSLSLGEISYRFSVVGKVK